MDVYFSLNLANELHCMQVGDALKISKDLLALEPIKCCKNFRSFLNSVLSGTLKATIKSTIVEIAAQKLRSATFMPRKGLF